MEKSTAGAWAARVTEDHCKAGRTEEADALKELVWSKYGRKGNYTAAAVLQAALNVEEYHKAGKTEKANKLKVLVWSRHEDFDRRVWLADD